MFPFPDLDLLLIFLFTLLGTGGMFQLFVSPILRDITLLDILFRFCNSFLLCSLLEHPPECPRSVTSIREHRMYNLASIEPKSTETIQKITLKRCRKDDGCRCMQHGGEILRSDHLKS